MILNAYLICIRFTRGSTIKRTVHVGRSVLGRVQSREASPDEKIPFPFMKKGEIFTICKGKFFEKEHIGMVLWGVMVTRGSISDMTSILNQSVSINAKGGYCWLFGLVVIDVNP
jgi:hypothetical protein